MALKVIGVIPARMHSKRFYGKVLFDYQGKPLIWYLYQELAKSKVMDRVVIATDNNKVRKTAEGFGAHVVMTTGKLQTGSDRVAQVMDSVEGDIFVNIQGDVFGLKSAALDTALGKFSSIPTLEYGTLARKIGTDKELNSPDSVKVVLKSNGDAGWFSRYPLPYIRCSSKKPISKHFNFYYHIGVYMFKSGALKEFAGWAQSPCEKAESLEQLRILENGKNIRVFLTNLKTVSVDSPKDVKNLKEVLN